MAVFKCKMCGGSLEITENQSVATCEYCGTQQTLPRFDDERKVALFTRANHLRFNCEFDKAAGVYESIVTEFPDEAEAYWGIVLCKYGIEYVDDKNGKKIPTCHRTSPTSIMDDENFSLACDYADSSSKAVYREEAKAIDAIQKKILQIASTEKPYDIFICYKETDEATGARTEDSAIAQDIYTELIKEGYKVFFSRVTLREVAGTEYEPYIYAALSSSKVMLAIGTKFEYYDAIWVKNEWSRFISMIGEDSSKVLIPCYKNMDAYDMPKEFKNMQALDMGDVTFFASLTANIKRLVKTKKESSSQPASTGATATVDSLLKRAFMFLEDGDFAQANQFCEQVLNVDPENADAYLGKLMAELHVSKKESLKDVAMPFNNSSNYQKVVRFGNEEQKGFLNECLKLVIERNESNRLESAYNKGKQLMASAKKEGQYSEAVKIFESINGYKDSAKLIEDCNEEIKRKKKRKKSIAISIPTSIISIALCVLLLITVVIPKIKFSDIVSISAGTSHTVGLKSDGTVVAVGHNGYGQCNVDSWTDTESISAGGGHTVGLKADRTVVAVGYNYYGRCDVDAWADIVAISAGDNHTVGLKSDGTVVAVGYDGGQCDVDSWTDIVSISAGDYHTVGLKSDGTVVAVGRNDAGRCDVDSWTDIVAISAGCNHTVGLKADGTVVAVGHNGYGQCDVDSWTDIVAISADGWHTVGLKSDGTVVAVGRNDDGQCDVSSWTDIVAISAGGDHTVGLKSDDTVVAVGRNIHGQCFVGGSK